MKTSIDLNIVFGGGQDSTTCLFLTTEHMKRPSCHLAIWPTSSS